MTPKLRHQKIEVQSTYEGLVCTEMSRLLDVIIKYKVFQLTNMNVSYHLIDHTYKKMLDSY